MMNVFAITAGFVAVIQAVALWERPRAAVLVSGVLWLLYAYHEHLIATGVLCDASCNIRVDLVFFFPILGVVTFCAYRAYKGRPGQFIAILALLSVIGLLAFALVAESSGYGALQGVAIAAALMIAGYGLVSVFRAEALQRSGRHPHPSSPK